VSKLVLGEPDVTSLRACMDAGGVAVFPADTVYGLCCDPDNERAVAQLYAIKGRPAQRPSAVMFFALEEALSALSALYDDERRALQALLPGPVTLLLANRARRFIPACGPDPATLGVRVPLLPPALEGLQGLNRAIMQSSANHSGGADARTLAAVPMSVRESADLELDGGELPGTPSTVVDLRDYVRDRSWRVLREGALPHESVRRLLAPLRTGMPDSGGS
jgi:L-threonylcarbamoyladenylate synthase